MFISLAEEFISIAEKCLISPNNVISVIKQKMLKTAIQAALNQKTLG
jgi:hypothetical protein